MMSLTRLRKTEASFLCVVRGVRWLLLKTAGGAMVTGKALCCRRATQGFVVFDNVREGVEER